MIKHTVDLEKASDITVIGLGYVGLPLAVQAAQKGYTVHGIDTSHEKVKRINERISPFPDDHRFTEAFKATSTEQFQATTDFAVIDTTDIVIICVPTPTENKVPDMSYVVAAAKAAAKHLHKGQLVVIESTVNPGATRKTVLPVLEEGSGLQCGVDFYLAHCPERIDPGNPVLNVSNINRVVGGTTAACLQAATRLYESITDAQIIPLGSLEEAEFVKSWENSQRNVLIALANQAAIICDAMGMDINSVTRGLQSKIDQFGLRLAKPGIGPGGHCIPEDIHYVVREARSHGLDTRLLDDAAGLNDKMPAYSIQVLNDALRQDGIALQNARVALLGIAYKENIPDTRCSPAIEVAHLLARQAQDVVVHDPFTQRVNINIPGVTHASDIESALQNADVVFVATAHGEYVEKLTPELLKSHGVRYVLDGRNCLDKQAFVESGLHYKGIGR